MNKKEKREVDILILNGCFLTLNPEREIIGEGAAAIKDGYIVALGKGEELKKTFSAQEYLDAKDCLVMPGLINAHTHAAMVCFRGLADDLPLLEWLERYIFPAESKNGSEELVYFGTLLACAEMIRSGTTTFCDMYLFEDKVAEAAKEAGVRAVVGEVLFDFPSPNVKNPEEGLAYTEALIQRWQGDPLITPAVEPHATYTCSPSLLKECKNLADKYEVSLITHLSESEAEVKQVKEKYGKTPVYHLADLGILDKNLIADHCVCLKEEEIGLLKRHQVKVVHNPESNMKLASGVAPVPELLAQGVEVALGTDGCASNNDLDMFQEMDSAAKLHKVYRLDPTVMKAEKVVEMATLGGARVLGLEKEIGSLEVEKKADLILLDLNRPHLIPLYNPYSHLVYAACGADVVTTIINGKIVMKEGKVLTLEEGAVIKKVREIAQKIRKSLKRINGPSL